MRKRTAIIDIGSNSARLVIFEKTSKYGFHLICEQKSKVRIGEGAYAKNGYLQPIGITRAYLTLKSFVHTIEKYQAKKTICVATSALRDAPNGKLFTQWIKKELGLSITIIDGLKEASYGAIAAVNLLPIREGISIDIGGGSSDMALIKNGVIVDKIMWRHDQVQWCRNTLEYAPCDIKFRTVAWAEKAQGNPRMMAA